MCRQHGNSPTTINKKTFVVCNKKVLCLLKEVGVHCILKINSICIEEDIYVSKIVQTRIKVLITKLFLEVKCLITFNHPPNSWLNYPGILHRCLMNVMTSHLIPAFKANYLSNTATVQLKDITGNKILSTRKLSGTLWTQRWPASVSVGPVCTCCLSRLLLKMWV